jgi:hypothetical protein
MAEKDLCEENMQLGLTWYEEHQYCQFSLELSQNPPHQQHLCYLIYIYIYIHTHTHTYTHTNTVLFFFKKMFRGTLSSNILKFLLSPVRFTKCLGVCVTLRPPRKKALCVYIYIYIHTHIKNTNI